MTYVFDPAGSAVPVSISLSSRRAGRRVGDLPNYRDGRIGFANGSWLMQIMTSNKLQQAARLLACVLILKVTAAVIVGYRDYLPPNFESGFLQGRQAYFWNGYQWPFYLHIAFGPCALVLGIVLMSERFRRRFSQAHRYLGRLQAVCVLLLVVPSGLWMACYAETGPLAGIGFATLGAATGLSVLLGWRSAARRQFAEHRRWMSRCFLLLCSAVVLRLIGGAFTVAGVEGEWTYALAAWASWLAPLLAFEFIRSGDAPSAQGRKKAPAALDLIARMNPTGSFSDHAES